MKSVMMHLFLADVNPSLEDDIVELVEVPYDGEYREKFDALVQNGEEEMVENQNAEEDVSENQGVDSSAVVENEIEFLAQTECT